MTKAIPLRFKYVTLLVSALAFSFVSCERNDYELLDPENAGKWELFTTADGLPSNSVSDITLDRRGNLWFTFPQAGIAKLDSAGWTYFRTDNTPLLTNGVICLAETAAGDVVFGTSNGISILSLNNDWSSYLDPVNSMYVNTIKVASNGWIWVGTRDQGYYLNTGSGFTKILTEKYKTVNSIEEGIAGNIFIGTDSGLIRWNGTVYSYLSSADGLPVDKITSLRRDTRNRLWVGTGGGKTVSWLDDKGIHQLNLMTGSDSIFVKDIWEDRRGDLWFATFNDGVIWFDGVVPRSFKVFNGFPENKVTCIAEDKDGNLWFGLASKGLVKYTLPITGK